MTVLLYDALYPAGIPLDIPANAIVASYVDHPEVVPPCMTQLAARFPNHCRATIAAHGGDAQIADIETGAMNATDLIWWLPKQRARGVTPAVYASPDNWTSVKQVCIANRIALPLWWAVWRLLGPIIPNGAVGNQYLGVGPYDLSVITEEWAAILMTSANPDQAGIYNIFNAGPPGGVPVADAGSSFQYALALGLVPVLAALNALQGAVAALTPPPLGSGGNTGEPASYAGTVSFALSPVGSSAPAPTVAHTIDDQNAGLAAPPAGQAGTNPPATIPDPPTE